MPPPPIVMNPIKHFNELPLDIARHVFRRLALQELLIARAVCRSWRWVIENEIFVTRKSLKFFHSFNDITLHANILQAMGLDADPLLRLRNGGLEDDLIINWSRIDHSFVRLFANLFPRIDSLVWHIDPSFAELINLIEMWSGTLRNISIFGVQFDQLYSDSLCKALLSVEHLTRLDIFSGSMLNNSFDLRLAPIIPQLQVLTMKGFYDFEPILDLLRDCTELRLDWDEFSDQDFWQTFGKNRAITRQITKFCLYHVDPNLISVLCDNLRNLRHFELHMEIDLDATILREFAKLSHLDSLHLIGVHIDLDDLTAAYVARTLPVLGSVKTVHLFTAPFQQLSDDNSGGDDRFCHLIRFIFPAIVRLHLRTEQQTINQTITRWRLPDCALTIRRLNLIEYIARHLGRHQAILRARGRVGQIGLFSFFG